MTPLLWAGLALIFTGLAIASFLTLDYLVERRRTRQRDRRHRHA